MKPVGIKQIALQAGVSIGTVDRVIHNRDGVSEQTRKKVLDVIDQLGFQKNSLASRLASKKKFQIAILIPAPENNSYWEKQFEALKRSAQQHELLGFRLSFIFFDLNDKQAYHTLISSLSVTTYDGLITVPCFPDLLNPLLIDFESAQKPVVFIDTKAPQNILFGYNIYQNSYRAGQVAGSLLHKIVNNAQTVALCNLETSHHQNINDAGRSHGFIDFFEKNAPLTSIEQISFSFTDANALEKKLTHLFRQQEISGVFVPNSRSFMVCQILKNMDHHIPCIGFDINPQNISYLDKGTLDFLIDQQPEEQAAKAIDILVNMCIHEKVIVQQDHEVAINIIVREHISL